MALRAGVKRFVGLSAPKAVLTRSLQHAADRVQVRLPEELDLNLKWSLVDNDVLAKGRVLANLDWYRLKMLAKKAKLPEKSTGKPLTVKRVNVDEQHLEYDKLYNEVTKYFSSIKAFFTCDGVLGAASDATTRTRVITDSPAIAMLSKALLRSVRNPNYAAARPIVLYVATQGDFKDKEPQGFSYMDVDENGTPYIKVVVTGPAELTALKDTLALANKDLAERNADSLLLPADLMRPRGGKLALVFSTSPAFRAACVSSGALIGAHLSVWSPSGVSPLFGGAVVDGSKRVSEDASVALENGFAVPIKSRRFVVQDPAAAVFVDKSESGLRPLKPSEAGALVKKLDSMVDTKKFEQYLQKSSTKAFAVASEADISSVFSKV